MKVDMKIVPIEVEEKSGWFSTKKRKKHQLQYRIELTEVEKAVINKAGLRNFVYREKDEGLPGQPDIIQRPIWPWVDETVPGYGTTSFDTLIEAQAESQTIKANLTKLKEIMDNLTQTPTEESFEL